MIIASDSAKLPGLLSAVYLASAHDWDDASEALRGAENSFLSATIVLSARQ